MRFKKLFPKEEEETAILAEMVNETTILQLVNVNSGTTMHWGKHLRYAFLLQNEIEFYWEAKNFGYMPETCGQIIAIESYDLKGRVSALAKAKDTLMVLTRSINRLALNSGLPPVLPDLESMGKDQAVKALFAYIEAYIRREKLKIANAV